MLSVDKPMPRKAASTIMAHEASAELELQWIARARDGDAAAYGELVQLHQQRLFAGVVRTVRDEHKALDIVQEAFVQAWRAMETYEDRAKFSTWLFRIAMNLVTSRHRYEKALKRGGEQARASLDAEGMLEPGAEQRTPDDLAEAGETGAIVRAAIDSLEDEYRDVIVMRDLQDMSYEEIAEILGLPPGTVRSRLHRGRDKLKDKLKHLV